MFGKMKMPDMGHWHPLFYNYTINDDFVWQTIKNQHFSYSNTAYLQ